MEAPSFLLFFSPFLFSLYLNDVDCTARDVRGAVTGMADVCVTHMLYADDLSLTENEPGQLQMMLNRLSTYALRKGLCEHIKIRGGAL